MERSKCYKTIRKNQGRATCIRLRKPTLKIQHKLSNPDGKFVSAYDLHKLPTQRHLRNAVFDTNLNSQVPSGLFGTQETRANFRK